MLLLQGHTDAVRCLAYAPDGKTLFTGSDDRTLRSWQPAAVASGQRVFEFPHWVEALAVAPHGHALTVGVADGGLHRFRWQDGQWRMHQDGWLKQAVGRLTGGKPAPVRTLTFSADGARLAAARWEKRVQLFSSATLGVLAEATTSSQLMGLAFAPDGKVLAGAGGDGPIYLYHGVTGKLQATLPGAPAGSLSVAFAADGKLLASGHADGSVLLWDVALGKQVATLSGHRWAVYSLAISPTGHLLLTGSADGTVRLWNVAGRSEQAAFQWHTQGVTAVAFAPDGMTAAAASSDHTIAIWDVM